MLARQNRLKSERDIRRLMKAGHFVSGKLIGLKVAPNRLAATRIGFSVGTKVSKKATVRNLLRRRMREIFRPQLRALAPGFDILVIAKPGLQDLNFRGLEAEIRGLLTRAGLS